MVAGAAIKASGTGSPPARRSAGDCRQGMSGVDRSRLRSLTHQRLQDLAGLVGVVDLDLIRVCTSGSRVVSQLLGVHLAEPWVPHGDQQAWAGQWCAR